MATQMLVPLLLLGGATVALAAASSKKKQDAAPPGTVRTYTLDTSLPNGVRDQVLAALATEQDPTKLEAFAAAIAPTFPLSASALRQKAAMLRAGTLPKNPVDLLTEVPDPMRTQVMQQLMLQNDPNALEAYATQLAAQYPAAAAALRMKEAVLRGQAPEVAPPTPGAAPMPPAVAPPAPSTSPVPPSIDAPDIAPSSISPAPAPATPEIVIPPIPLPSIIAAPSAPASAPSVPASPVIPTPVAPSSPATFLPGLDANMPPEMQKAVAGALTTESDPAKLEGFASAIQAQYPIASGLLKAKAEALRLMPAIATPSPPPPVPPPIALPNVPSPASIATNGTYTVLPGDFPIKIAQKLVGNGNRWRELVAANPQKKTAPDGNFASLLPGEVLRLPASWMAPSPAVPSPASPSAPLANALSSLAPALAAIPSAVAALPATLSLPPAPPTALSTTPQTIAASLASGTYKVISGDNPSKIALKLAGNGNRWKELVAANPQKRTGSDGNFVSLLPGEVLHLPASWIGGASAAHA